MRKLIMALFIIVMLNMSCKSELTSSETGFETSNFIYANNITVTLQGDLYGEANKVAPIPHFGAQTLTSTTIKAVEANMTSTDNYSVSDTVNALKDSLTLDGSMKNNVTLDVTGVRNNKTKATFTVIVNEKSGYKFDNGVTDRFNIVSEITTGGAWIEKIDMTKRTFVIVANRHTGGEGAYNLSFPATDTVFFRNGAIVPTTIRLLIADDTAVTKSITQSILAAVIKNVVLEAINKDASLNGKIDVTSIEETFVAGTDTGTGDETTGTRATLKVKVTIKSIDPILCILTLAEDKTETMGTITIEAAVLGANTVGTITE